MMEQRSQMLKQMRLSCAERDREVLKPSHLLCLLCTNIDFYQQKNNTEVIKEYYEMTNDIIPHFVKCNKVKNLRFVNSL